MSSEKITLHEIKCPNCGATISRFNAFAVTCRCPNCDKIFQILGGAHSRDIDRPERIFPFKITKEEFHKKFSDCFWREFSREYGQKVSAEAEFGDETPFYVATYFFDGNVPLECSVMARKSDDFLSEGTVCAITFDSRMEMSGAATDAAALPSGIADCVMSFPYRRKRIEFFAKEKLASWEDCVVIDRALPPEFVWERDVEGRLMEEIDEDVLKNAVKSRGLEMCSGGFRSARTTGMTTWRLAFVPVWRVGFTWKGKSYYYVANGMDGSIVSDWTPGNDSLKEKKKSINEFFSFPKDPIREAERKAKEEKDLRLGCCIALFLLAVVGAVISVVVGTLGVDKVLGQVFLWTGVMLTFGALGAGIMGFKTKGCGCLISIVLLLLAGLLMNLSEAFTK